MGGVGKTELVLQYVREKWEKVYPGGVCWLEARRQDVGIQILTFGRIHFDQHPSEELPLEARVAYYWSKWPDFCVQNEAVPSPVLIVIDDVVDYASIEPYLPASSRFTILVTTRFQHLSTTLKNLSIEVLGRFESLNLLIKLIGEQRVHAELEQANLLCNWLGFLPLAIELVGLYLSRKPFLSLNEIQARLENQEFNARILAKTQPGMTNPLGVASAFELSWKDMDSETAKYLAYSLSLFASMPIPWRIVEHCFSDLGVAVLEEARDDYLLNSSFLNRCDDCNGNSFQLHQLVREFLKSKSKDLDEDHSARKIIANKLSQLSEEIPEDLEKGRLYEFSLVIPHLEEIANNFDNYLDDSYFSLLFRGIGRFYESQGLYNLAHKIHTTFRKKSQKRFGLNHLNTVKAMYELAIVRYSLGDFSGAEKLQRDAISNVILPEQAMNSSEKLFLADILNSLGLTLTAKEEYIEAEELLTRSLEIRESLLGVTHADVADSFNNIGLLYCNKGGYENAEPLLAKSLKIRKAIFGGQHLRVAASLNNLASCLYNQERFKESENLYFQALVLYKRLHADSHRDVAKTLNNLAQVYSIQGDLIDAEPLFLEALEIQKTILGDIHPDIAFSLNNIAALYEDLGQPVKAEIFYKQALKMREETLGKKHSFVAITMNNLAKLFQNNGRYTEAKPLYKRSVKILRNNLQEDHPILVRVRSNLEALEEILEED